MAERKLIYFGHSAVLLETEGGKRIIIDPFLDGNPLCPEHLQDPGPIDYICLTHGHGDHVGSTVSLAKKYGSTVFAAFELATLLAADGVPEQNIEYMNKGGRVEMPDSNGLAVTLTQAFHSSSYTAADGSVHYAGEAAGLVIELESGDAIYHAGDTLLFEDMKLIAERFSLAVALLPIGDRFTMGPEDAAKAVELLNPAYVVPIHHSTFPMLSGKPEHFASLIEGKESQAVILAPGQDMLVAAKQ